MQVPKKKTSKSKRNMRRSHHALSASMLVPCQNCGDRKLRHVICPSCGVYRNKAMVEVSAE